MPVVWEYLPYRLWDDLRWRDDKTGENLAPYGVIFVRVDIRGTGNSEGVMVDEYDVPELTDGVQVIAWLARQSWSNGSVGMRGISWGGINALQIAAMRPPELKAIMPMGCVVDRYTDDAHYMGGWVMGEVGSRSHVLGRHKPIHGAGGQNVLFCTPPHVTSSSRPQWWSRCARGRSRRPRDTQLRVIEASDLVL